MIPIRKMSTDPYNGCTKHNAHVLAWYTHRFYLEYNQDRGSGLYGR